MSHWEFYLVLDVVEENDVVGGVATLLGEVYEIKGTQLGNIFVGSCMFQLSVNHTSYDLLHLFISKFSFYPTNTISTHTTQKFLRCWMKQPFNKQNKKTQNNNTK